MQTTLKVLLVLCLSVSFVMADDGDMGGGGLSDGSVYVSKTVVTQNEGDGDMGGGGKTCTTGQTCLVSDDTTYWAAFISYLGL